MFIAFKSFALADNTNIYGAVTIENGDVERYKMMKIKKQEDGACHSAKLIE